MQLQRLTFYKALNDSDSYFRDSIMCLILIVDFITSVIYGMMENLMAQRMELFAR